MLEFIVHAFSSEVCYVFDSQGMYLFLSVFFLYVLFLERDVPIDNLVRSPP